MVSTRPKIKVNRKEMFIFRYDITSFEFRLKSNHVSLHFQSQLQFVYLLISVLSC